AGVSMCVQLAQRRTELAEFFEASTDAIYIADASGGDVHQNRQLVQLLADDPEGNRLIDEARHVITAMSSLVHARRKGNGNGAGNWHAGHAAWRDVRTARGRYRLHGTLLGTATFGVEPYVAVQIMRVASRPLNGDDLCARYRLSMREIEVARLLAEGRSTRELSDALHISSHTARHHTENVMRKLGVTHRAEVSGKLRGN
ncbi:MAG: response regulator transcription factor, partial [Gemmatimonadaceae bacterium]